jgi:Galactose oxidase, central domain
LTSWLWTQKQDIGPSARRFHAMAYDSFRKRVVLFGGTKQDGGTWEWDGSAWTQVADMGPPPRESPAMAFDFDRNRLVLFGGGEIPELGDTWEWDGSEWTQLADMGPSSRYASAMAYDQVRKRIILHGGANTSASGTGTTVLFSDAWEWDGTEWVQISDSGPARAYAGMVFDETRGSLWLFGGMTNAAPETPAGDTWEFNGTVWTERQNMGPAPMLSPKMVFANTRTILLGGGLPGGAAETWEWNETFWTKRQNMGPSARGGHALAYDSDRDRTVLFGGGALNSAVLLGDTWELAIS